MEFASRYIRVRPAEPADLPGILAVHEEAFEQTAEARIVELLVHRNRAVRSLVAERSTMPGLVVGHILMSEVHIQPRLDAAGIVSRDSIFLGLAPLAVLPSYQGQGIGQMLTRQTLSTEVLPGSCAAVFVLGDPEYYGRFGFEPAAPYGFDNEYEAGDAFQVWFPDMQRGQDLVAAMAGGPRRLVQYQPEFAEVGV